jgi:hypothetical protein
VDLNCAKFIKASTGGAVLVGNPGDDEAVQKSENDPLDFLTFVILLGAAGLFLCCLIAFLIFRLNKKKQTRIIDVSKGDDTFDKKYSMPA